MGAGNDLWVTVLAKSGPPGLEGVWSQAGIVAQACTKELKQEDCLLFEETRAEQ